MSAGIRITLGGVAAMIESSNRTFVWDFPVRVFHWSLVLTFAVAYATAE